MSRISSFEELHTTIAAFAAITLRNADAEALRSKVAEEAREWLADQDDDEELADMVIAILAYAAKKGIDIRQLIDKKMGKNLARTWEWDAERGVYHHV